MKGMVFFRRTRFRSCRRWAGRTLVLSGLLLLAGPAPTRAQTPRDQIHFSVHLGGYVKAGFGLTHWAGDHHAMEFTAFPLAYPWEGFHMDLKAGYSWVPSDEIWRAKLGANATLLIHKPSGEAGWFTPLFSFTPGIHYTPEQERYFRLDLLMSYYVNEKVFAPTGFEFLYGLVK